MLVHPHDFHRLDELDRMLAEAAELPSLEPTHQALRAHLEEGTPGEPITGEKHAISGHFRLGRPLGAIEMVLRRV